MKNSSLRARFGIDTRNAAQVSQVIRRARDRLLIKAADPAHPQSGLCAVLGHESRFTVPKVQHML